MYHYRSATALFLCATLALLLSSGCSTVSALNGTCRLWNGVPTHCTQFKEYLSGTTHIFVPFGSTLEEQQAKATTVINTAGTAGPLIGLDCATYYANMACSTHLRPCTTDGTMWKPIPQQPCEVVCNKYVSECAPKIVNAGRIPGMGLYFPPGFRAPITCTERDINMFNDFMFQVPTYDAFALASNDTIPEDITEDWLRIAANASCNGPTFRDYVAVVCQPPLVQDPDNPIRCGFACPLPSYSDKQYDAVKIVQTVFGWLSLVGSALVVISYAFHPSLRAFPANLIMMASIAAHIAAWAIVFPSFVGHEDVWCGPDGEFLSPTWVLGLQITVDFEFDQLLSKSSICTFQGFLLQFGFLSTTMWWGNIAFNMFITIYFHKMLPKSAGFKTGLQVLLHVVGWVVPFILILIPAAAEKMAFQPGDTFCSISPEDDNVWFIVFWALPVGIVLLVGLALFVGSIVQIVRAAIQANQIQRAFVTYYRLLIFIFLYLMLYCFIFAYTLDLSANQAEVEESYGEYLACLSFEDDCHLSSDAHNYPLAVLRGFAYSVLGFCLFLTFCISEPVFKFWRAFFPALARGHFSSAFNPSESNTSTNKKPNKTTAASHKMTITMRDDENTILDEDVRL
ncbi:hypothetical protein QOT17_024045 [Balamuthia mandrillaris]